MAPRTRLSISFKNQHSRPITRQEPSDWVVGIRREPVMTDIYLLIASGTDQSDAYVLGWFDDRNKAREAAEQKEWEAYRASLKAEHPWSSQKPLAPDKTEYRRYWIKTVSKFEHVSVPRSLAVH